MCLISWSHLLSLSLAPQVVTELCIWRDWILTSKVRACSIWLMGVMTGRGSCIELSVKPDPANAMKMANTVMNLVLREHFYLIKSLILGHFPCYYVAHELSIKFLASLYVGL